MDGVTVVFVLVLAIATICGFFVYRWRQQQRVRDVNLKIKDYLRGRFGRVPDNLTINCSDDPLWPILVSFTTAPYDDKHRLQFMCAGPISTLALLTE